LKEHYWDDSEKVVEDLDYFVGRISLLLQNLQMLAK
jgi:hypothetical protein